MENLANNKRTSLLRQIGIGQKKFYCTGHWSLLPGLFRTCWQAVHNCRGLSHKTFYICNFNLLALHYKSSQFYLQIQDKDSSLDWNTLAYCSKEILVLVKRFYCTGLQCIMPWNISLNSKRKNAKRKLVNLKQNRCPNNSRRGWAYTIDFFRFFTQTRYFKVVPSNE